MVAFPRARRPFAAAPLALSALLLGPLAGCEEANAPAPEAAAPEPEVAGVGTDADVLTDSPPPAPALPAPDAETAGDEPPAADEPAEFAAIREALPAGAAAQLGPMMDGWASRNEDPMVATETAYALMQAGMMLAETDEELAYDAFRLGGEAGEAAIAGELPADVPREIYGNIFYNQACALSLDGETDAAAAALARAAEYGWTDWDQVLADPDLAALRETPGFEERVAGWKAAAEAAVVAQAERDLAEGEPFPLEFTFTDTEGEERSLGDYEGKVVVADFWGTWCPPCRDEIPAFVALQEDYGDDGLQILGLNYRPDGGPEDADTIADFVQEYGMNYPTGNGPEEAQGMVSLRSFPTTVFVGRDGTVRVKVVGSHPKAYLETLVKELLAEPAPPADIAPADAEPAETADAAGAEPADDDSSALPAPIAGGESGGEG